MTAPLSAERLAEIRDGRYQVRSLAAADEHITALLADNDRLRARAALVSEYHVLTSDGFPLSVRRDPNSTRWAVSTMGTGIHVRIGGEWQPLAVASRVGVWAFPDVDAALDEAHRLAGGAL